MFSLAGVYYGENEAAADCLDFVNGRIRKREDPAFELESTDALFLETDDLALEIEKASQKSRLEPKQYPKLTFKGE